MQRNIVNDILIGIVFTASPYDSVYNGIWGFNAILAAVKSGLNETESLDVRIVPPLL